MKTRNTILLTLSLLIFAGKTTFAQTPSLTQVRELFRNSSSNEDNAEKFRDVLEKTDVSRDPVLMGYKGMSVMMMCNFTINPLKKLHYFDVGKALLEFAIKMAPENAELRFLRASVQDNAPVFLAYNGKRGEDWQIVNQALASKQIPSDLAALISDYKKKKA